jgi:hypothetical protein
VDLLRDDLEHAGAFLEPILPSIGDKIQPIHGVDVTAGFACNVPGDCFGTVFASTRSRDRHFQQSHPGLSATENSRETKVQVLNSWRGQQMLIEVNDGASRPIVKGRFRAYMDGNKQRETPRLYHVKANDRERTSFETLSNWDRMLEGCDVALVSAAAQLPTQDQEPLLFQLCVEVTNYIVHVAALCPQIHITLLRQINTASG